MYIFGDFDGSPPFSWQFSDSSHLALCFDKFSGPGVLIQAVLCIDRRVADFGFFKMLDVNLAERFSFRYLKCEIVSHCLQRRKRVIYYALVAAEVVHLGVRHFWLPAVARLLQKGAHRYNRVFYVEDDVRALPCWDL